MENKPRIGVGVIILKNNRVLLGKRRNPHGDGAWGFPGGHFNISKFPEIVKMIKNDVRK